MQRDYVFFSLGLVAVVGVLRGLWPALLCSAISFLFVDYFFVLAMYTWTIAASIQTEVRYNVLVSA